MSRPGPARTSTAAKGSEGPKQEPPEVTKSTSDGEQGETRQQSQSTQLVVLAEEAELFHAPDEEAYATVGVADHFETWPVRSRGFRRWLAKRFYTTHQKAPSQQALSDALNVLEGKAVCDGTEYEVFVRVAECEGVIYVDLGDPTWSAVQISPTGWEIVANPPVKFRRARGAAALGKPETGGNIGHLRQFINVASEGDWVLFVGWLVAALRPKGPFPILVLYGEQGSAKSTTARVAKLLVDPSTAPLRSEPRDVRDIMIAARNSWCAVFDNLSHLSVSFSDVLCRLATGGGFATRELYSDADEVLFDAQRPLLLNGIEELASRGDLLDRSLILTLPAIPEEQRRSEREFWAAFTREQPRIFGALCEAVSCAMRNLTTTQLAGLPRMADVAQWVTAAEPGLGWAPRAFLTAYNGNRELANDVALEWSSVAAGIIGLVEPGHAFAGTATELLARLGTVTDEEVRRRRGWPQTPQALSGILRRLAPNLRAVGISVDWNRDPSRARTRVISITRSEGAAVQTVQGVHAEDAPQAGLDGADGDFPATGDNPMLRAANDSGLVQAPQREAD